MPIDAMTPSATREVFRAVQRTLRQQGVKDVVSAIHFETQVDTLVCLRPKVRRMVCTIVNGTPVCRPACVDP
jgi:hypothetical protein